MSELCREPLSDPDGFHARCAVERGVDHSHHDRTARQAVADRLAVNSLAYGFHRLVPDHDSIAGWGARLLFDEFKRGELIAGVVWDRQDVFGDRALVEGLLFPALDSWARKFRDMVMVRYDASGSDEIVTEDLLMKQDDVFYRVLVKGSCQSSYGYIYVTALLSVAEGES